MAPLEPSAHMTRTARPKKFGLEMMASLVTAWRAGGMELQGSGGRGQELQETGNRKQEAGTACGTGGGREESARVDRTEYSCEPRGRQEGDLAGGAAGRQRWAGQARSACLHPPGFT